MKIFKSILILLAAVLLAAILLPIGLVFAFVHSLIQYRDAQYQRFWADMFYSLALGIDKVGNVVCGALFNRVLIVDSPWTYKFGSINDTVSYALAKNYPKRTTRAGNMLVWILELIDPGHMEKSLKRKY